MSQMLYKKNVKEITDAIAGVVVFVVFAWLVWVIAVTFVPDNAYSQNIETITEDMWRFESSPSDRRAILEGLNAMDCIDAGLCQLTIKLPVAE